MRAEHKYPILLLVLIVALFIWPSDASKTPYRHRPHNKNHHHQRVEQSSKLQEVYSWKELDFDYPDKLARSEAIRNGSFIPGALVPIDTDVYYGKTYFKKKFLLFFEIQVFNIV